jgi:MinD superfamily P-loop ATPase
VEHAVTILVERQLLQNQSQCSGPCDPGFYCPEGSVSPTEKLCGDTDKYCPRGSYKPTMVSPGYFSIGKLT